MQRILFLFFHPFFFLRMQQVQEKDFFRRKEKREGSLSLESLRERNPKVWNHWEDGQGEKGKKIRKIRKKLEF